MHAWLAEMEPEERRRRLRTRNYVLAAVLLGLALLFFVITLVKLQGS